MATVKDYNQKSAELYPSDPYYNRDTTDKDVQDEFDDNMKELKSFGSKLKNELLKGNNPKLHIQGEIELSK